MLQSDCATVDIAIKGVLSTEQTSSLRYRLRSGDEDGGSDSWCPHVS